MLLEPLKPRNLATVLILETDLSQVKRIEIDEISLAKEKEICRNNRRLRY